MVIDVIGWTGAILLLTAYALVSARRVEGDATVFQTLNLIGSAFLILNSLAYGAYPSAGVNSFWIAIALLALLKGRRGAQAKIAAQEQPPPSS